MLVPGQIARAAHAARRPPLPVRAIDRALAPLCLLGSLLVAVTHGRLALGLVSFYLGLQCGALHLVRVLGYQLPPSWRYATAGVALGVAFSLHAGARGGAGGDVYLEYVAGPPGRRAGRRADRRAAARVVPLAATTHLRGAPIVPPWPPMLAAAAEVALVALAHEAVVDGPARALADGSARAPARPARLRRRLGAAAETVNRVLLQGGLWMK